MKSFLVTLILSSVTLAESDSGPCNPVSLYRWRSKQPINIQPINAPPPNINLTVFDHVETTKQNLVVDGTTTNYVKGRKIATICSNRAAGTVPLYNTLNEQTKLHNSIVGDPPADILPLGYVYTDAETAGPGSFSVYKKIRKLRILYSVLCKYLATDDKDEAADTFSDKISVLFYSLPKNLSPE